jgi:hypothetical protein
MFGLIRNKRGFEGDELVKVILWVVFFIIGLFAVGFLIRDLVS